VTDTAGHADARRRCDRACGKRGLILGDLRHHRLARAVEVLEAGGDELARRWNPGT